MRTILLPFLLAPPMAFAAGGGMPAVPTTTTTNCINGQVYDDKLGRCVTPQQSQLGDDTLYQAAREFAHQGAYADAQVALAAMSDQSEDRVLTYWGFTHRQLGSWDLGMAYYDQALTQNPDNILARSYLGQAMVQQGDTTAALVQLREIQARGGAGTWAEASLQTALLSGRAYQTN